MKGFQAMWSSSAAGDVAIDAARTALRIGADKVSILYRRTEAEMPARDEEIEDAREEGVEIRFLTLPKEVVVKDGKAVGITCIKMELGEPDDSGRRRPVPVDGSDFTLDADYIIPAIGQRTDASCLESSTGIEVNRWNNIVTDQISFQTSRQGVFAGGDAQTGASIAINAVAAGKEAATSIIRFLDGRDLKEGREPVEYAQKDFNTIPKDIAAQPRQHMARIDMEERRSGFAEVELGFTEEQALAEAGKCLDCMVCCECYECVKACLAGALTPETHRQQAEQRVLEIGAVVMAPGFKPFDPSGFDHFNFGIHPNVVTSMQFERILSASGPTQGHLVRLSDHREAKKVAWLQCVGSRDINRCDNKYCSSVCCMYALKEAVIAKEHAGESLDCAIFYMDMRTHGKDFEHSLNSAKSQGIRLVRSRVHSVEPIQGSDELNLRYVTEEGELADEIFDMVVLSVGLEVSPEVMALSKKVGIELTDGNFARTGSFSPVETSQKGFFVCGAFQGPKDIPQSVVDASAAAGEACAILSDARNTLTLKPEPVPQIDVRADRPRIGVFVCKCGSNINGVVDVPGVSEYAASLPYVEYACHNLYTCSQDTQDTMTEIIKENNLNRIVVAACTPKTHEPLFQETLMNAGLNKYLFEMTNIRNHASWVHKADSAMATQKAKDLIRMSVAKVTLMTPLEEGELTINPTAMVVGGGLSGMAAAKNLADQGYEVHVVERDSKLGGQANNLYQTYKEEDIQQGIANLIQTVNDKENIHVHLSTTLENVEGFVGNFKSELHTTGNEVITLDHGVAVLATGASPLKPMEYAYGQDDRILTSLELDKKFIAKDPDLKTLQSAVFIQCVGSREPDRPYCSRLCCTHSIGNALDLKKENPDMDIYILYRDIRTYGEREYLYQKAREMGVIFIRYDVDKKPEVQIKDGRLIVRVTEPLLNLPIEIETDLLTLATAIVPQKDERLANFL